LPKLDKTGGTNDSNVFLCKNLQFVWIFNPDLCQFWIKSALFTSS